VRGIRLNVGVIEKPVNPSTLTQSPMVADCETNRLRERAMLVPVTVMGEGKVTLSADVGGRGYKKRNSASLLHPTDRGQCKRIHHQ